VLAATTSPRMPPNGSELAGAADHGAVVAEVHRDHPYYPRIRRLRKRALTAQGGMIDLWPSNGLRIEKLQDIDVSAMYPPEKRLKKLGASVPQAA